MDISVTLDGDEIARKSVELLDASDIGDLSAKDLKVEFDPNSGEILIQFYRKDQREGTA